jgi:hypothetical protein
MEYAIKKNDLNLIKRLIENGEDINSTFTLWYAVNNDRSTKQQEIIYLNIVKFLVENGANIDMRGPNGETSLMNAIINEHVNIVKYLVDKGAKVELTDDYGLDAVFHAKNREYPNSSIVNYLEKYKKQQTMKQIQASAMLRKMFRHYKAPEAIEHKTRKMLFGKPLTKSLKNQAKKYKVKLTVKRKTKSGFKRVYKTEKILKKQIKNAIKRSKK